MPKPRIAFVVQRYGGQITGGSETHCRQVAERLTPFYDVEVLTTCATNHLTWKNDLPSGEEELNGVAVRRFPVDRERDLLSFHRLYAGIFTKQLSPEEELEMLHLQGPECPALIEYLRSSVDAYDAFIFFTYLYYPTVLGLAIAKSRAVFVPTAHDEHSLYVHILDDLFRQTPHILFNSEEEGFLLQRRFNLPENVGRIVGIGIELPPPGRTDPEWESLRRQIEGKRVLTYLGRIENGKGCDEMVDFFLRFIREQKRDEIVMLMLGRRTLPIPKHPQLLSPGFVSEYVKQQALSQTEVLIAPSPVESLCIAALEGMFTERPLLVNGRCDVLVGHCIRSNGGLWYDGYEDFSEALALLLRDGNVRRTLGRQGREYVCRKYRWGAVIQAYRDVLDGIISAHQPSRMRQAG